VKTLRKLLNVYLDAYFLFVSDLNKFDDSSIPQDQTLNLDGILLREYKSEFFCDLVNFCSSHNYFGATSDRVSDSVKNDLEKGYSCVIATDKDKIIGMAWFCYGSDKFWPNFAKFPEIPEGSALLLTDFVDKRYRGLGIHKKMIFLRKSLLKKKGFDDALTFVGVKNFYSINNYLKSSKKYRLIYNLIIEIPMSIKFVRFLNRKKESWISIDSPYS